MGTELRIVAVGDILMWRNQINAAANGKGGFNFSPMFAPVTNVLRGADFTIGNLETTLSGRENIYQRTNPKTGYPRFNCPDELGVALRQAGFNVVTTANNHCMDRGESGLKRTLRILDQQGIAHTGTFATKNDSTKLLVRTVKGMKIGVAAYTYGTNFIAVPKDKPWLVNRLFLSQIKADLQRLHKLCDVVLVAVHFGQEFQRMPNARQKSIVRILFKNGADIVLGAHPHVLQPVSVQTVTDIWGVKKMRVAAYSLGNFISDRMLGNRYADIGLMLRVVVGRDTDGVVRIRRIGFLPTWVKRIKRGTGYRFSVVGTASYQRMSPNDPLRKQLRQTHQQTLAHLRRKVT